MTTNGLGGGRMALTAAQTAGGFILQPVRKQNRLTGGQVAGWGKTGSDRCCRHCQTVARLVDEPDGWVSDRPSARCIPSHDRHDLMNITERRCQAAGQLLSHSPANSRANGRSNRQSEVTSQYTAKSQLVQKSASSTKPTGARPGDGMDD